ncbi:MAG: glycosyltransferase family 9 protein, partial [bacterium]
DFLSDPRSALLSRMTGAPVRIGIGYRGRGWAFTHSIPCQDPNRPMYSARHKAQLAEPFGEPVSTNCALEFFLRSEDEEAAAHLWKQKGWSKETPVVALGVHSRREYKRWPVERFAQVAQRLIYECEAAIAVLAGPGEEVPAQQVLRLLGDSRAHLLQPNSLGSLAACLSRCRLFLGNDGGPKHLAVAVGTPTVTLFGDEPFEFWTPPDNPSHIALGGRQLGEKGLASLTSQEVFEAARDLLATTH